MSTRLDTQARKLLELREKNAVAQKAAKAAKRELDEFESAFWSELEDLNTKTWSGDLGPGYGRVRITRRATRHSRILDKERLMESLRERGLEEEMLKAEPRKKVLNDYVRTLQETGEPLPDGLDFYDDRGLTVTRLK